MFFDVKDNDSMIMRDFELILYLLGPPISSTPNTAIHGRIESVKPFWVWHWRANPNLALHVHSLETLQRLADMIHTAKEAKSDKRHPQKYKMGYSASKFILISDIDVNSGRQSVKKNGSCCAARGRHGFKSLLASLWATISTYWPTNWIGRSRIS